MFVDQGTIKEVETALLAVPEVHTVEICELWKNGKLGLGVCSVLYGSPFGKKGSRAELFKVYEIEIELILRLPGIMFEFSTRVDMTQTFTTNSTSDVNFTWDVCGGD